mmetsp:Transcript_11737/g.27177  ORF Transcript_11737/g.27177 Transcript_11737/m.27177 type:complete len:138 (-) Transcript_11737:1847-2260(-)
MSFSWRLIPAVGVAGVASVAGGLAAITSINDEWDADTTTAVPPSREKLVILGTGWGALEVLRKANKANYDVTVVSPRPFFLYTPLLAGATVGTVHHGNIIEPIRNFVAVGGRGAGAAGEPLDWSTLPRHLQRHTSGH